MQLTVSFAGLMMFVLEPDETEEDKKVLHVIIPATAGGHGHLHQHVTSIIPDTLTTVSIGTLSDVEVDLTDVADDCGDGVPTFPSDVLHLGECCSTNDLKLERSFLDDYQRDPRVAVHLKLRGGTLSPTNYQCVTYPGKSSGIRVPGVLTWTAAVGRESIPSIRLKKLRENANDGTLDITTDSPQGHAWICIASTLPSEKPPTPGHVYLPPTGFDSEHLKSYGQFWTPSKGCAPEPCLRSESRRAYPRICPLVDVAAV